MKEFGKKETIDEISDLSEAKPHNENIFDISKYEDCEEEGERPLPKLYAPMGLTNYHQPHRHTAPLHYIQTARERHH